MGRNKGQLESIIPDINSSFHFLLNPKLSDLYYWHFHPEIELVFIEGASGNRYVGNHISPYYESDLVLIGSNIPHLNWDYGVKTDYRKVVLHVRPTFPEKVFYEVPELNSIYQLFIRAQHGIVFSKETKSTIGQRLFQFHKLKPFDQIIEFMQLFRILAESKNYQLLHTFPYVNEYSKKEQNRLKNIYAFTELKYQQKITINDAARVCNLSNAAFCRYFKKTTGQTYINFLNRYRITQAKRILLQGKSIGEACFSSGFESLSYFNRIFNQVTGENPSSYKMNH